MKKKIIIMSMAILILLSVVFITIRLFDKPDIKARVISVEELEVSEGTVETLIVVNGGEFGYNDAPVYVRITADTKIENNQGKYFPPNSFLKDDIVEVYYKDTSNKVIIAKKIVLLYYDNK